MNCKPYIGISSGMKQKSISKPKEFALKIRTSQYSKQYSRYMRGEWHQVEPLIRNIVQKPFCRKYYLKYPLDALLKATTKKMMLNMYQTVIYGYFLSLAKWELEWDIDEQLSQDIDDVFPNILHVNQPTDPTTLKHLSIFLYLSAFSVKEWLNEDVTIIRAQMIKLLPEFELILKYWAPKQPTVGKILQPKLLNSFYRNVGGLKNMADYNVSVDKILQISPCYNINGQSEKAQKVVDFGYMQQGGMRVEQGQRFLGVKMEEDMENYQFDGGDI